MTFSVVPSPATRAVARDMLFTARHESAADSVIRHLDDVRPEQVPALIGLLLAVVAPIPEAVVKINDHRPAIRPSHCADCRHPITGWARRGLCQSCYDRNRYDGTLDRFQRRIPERRSA